jgi:hypothetical protein
MAETTAWQEEKYNQVFEEELLALTRRSAHDPSCSISDLEAQLRDMYINEGNNQIGRGAVADITMAATIAAYECFIHQGKKAGMLAGEKPQ